MSLPQSALPCSSHLISSQPHAQTLPPTYSALSLCSLHFHNTHTHTHNHTNTHTHTHTHTQTHTHTRTRPLSCTPHPLKHKNIIYIFCTIHTRSTRSLSSWTQTLSKSLHITIGFPASGNTLCENVLSMCMYICSPNVYVYVIYVCMSVRCICV